MLFDSVNWLGKIVKRRSIKSMHRWPSMKSKLFLDSFVKKNSSSPTIHPSLPQPAPFLSIRATIFTIARAEYSRVLLIRDVLSSARRVLGLRRNSYSVMLRRRRIIFVVTVTVERRFDSVTRRARFSARRANTDRFLKRMTNVCRDNLLYVDDSKKIVNIQKFFKSNFHCRSIC